MTLSLDIIILGFVTLIYFIVFMVLAMKVLFNYFKTKEKIFIYAGVGCTGYPMAWSGFAYNFICLFFLNITPSIHVWFLLHGPYIPFSNFIWVLTAIKLSYMKENRKKLLISSIAIFHVILFILYLYFIFTDVTFLGTPSDPLGMDFSLYSEIVLLYFLFNCSASGLFIAKNTYKSDDERIRLKGKFLYVGFILLTIGAFFDIMFPTVPMQIAGRICVMFFGFFTYLGFVLPKWAERLFLKKKKPEIE